MATTLYLNEVEQRLSYWLIRLRLQHALLWSVRGLAAGVAAGLGLSLIARFRPFQPVLVLIVLSVSLALAGFTLALALAYFWPRPRLAAARYFDRLFGLAERTSTALELARADDRTPEWLRRDQWADAAGAARGVDPNRHLPFRFDRRDSLLLASLILALT